MSASATVPVRARTFEALGLPPEFVALLRKGGIAAPLPIQAMTIPDALAGRDIAGGAPTGSGKTLAFSLPMAARLSRGEPKRPRGLVLAPTRELAAQIARELAPFAKLRGLRVHAFYGGVGYTPQINAARSGVDIVVACPGRLEDLVDSGHIQLANVSFVVLDEADRMADMGFLPAVRRIMDRTRTDRQTLLFSATLDGDVDVLVRTYQHDPVRHQVASEVDDFGRVEHRFVELARDERLAETVRLITEHGSAIVFVRTKHGADRLARQLDRSGTPAVALHGDRSQGQRDRALADFRTGRARALVATDVASRGIHVDDVACVIHYDLPPEAKDYIHRSGRTARAGASGVVVALVTPETAQIAHALRRAIDPDRSQQRAHTPAVRSKHPRGSRGTGRSSRPVRFAQRSR